MKRKLFCEISPITYKISVLKGIFLRKLKDLFYNGKFAKYKSEELLPVSIYKHNSLIRRKLGNVDMQLQENKAVNLKIASSKVTNIIIKPNETFSLWHLVGPTTKANGYLKGLTISKGKPSVGIGGGLCQLTNLIHWMILHTQMSIIEHHHHEQVDLFPDYKRVIPFGTGTSIVYNYFDYRFINNTDITYQIKTYTNDKYLCGEILADKRQQYSYHIKSENEYFSLEDNGVYRNGDIYRYVIDIKTGLTIKKEHIKHNYAKVMYDYTNLKLIDKRSSK